MSIENLKSLLEIQALDLKIKEHLNKITSNTERFEFVNQTRQRKINRLDCCNTELIKVTKEISTEENLLNDFDTKISKAKENISIAANEQQINAAETTLATLTPKSEVCQNIILEKMYQQEEIFNEIKELKEFTAGSLESLNEIKFEVDGSNQGEEKEIGFYNERINLLKLNADKPFITAFEQANIKHRFKNPVTFLDGQCCQQCRFIQDSLAISNINNAKLIENCSGCNRILVSFAKVKF